MACRGATFHLFQCIPGKMGLSKWGMQVTANGMSREMTWSCLSLWTFTIWGPFCSASRLRHKHWPSARKRLLMTCWTKIQRYLSWAMWRQKEDSCHSAEDVISSTQEGSRNYNKYIIIALQRHFKWPIIIMQSHKDSCKTSNFYILYISFINPVESVSKTVHHLLAQTPLRIHLIHYRVTSGSLCEHFPTWNVIRLQLECLQHVYSLFRVLKLF